MNLGSWPTPLEECPGLSTALGGPHLWVKRDDLTGLGLGGNKVRKLEYLLGDAVRQGADTIVTTGGPQSNHARLTAAACRRLGLEVVLVLTGFSGPLTSFQGNLLLDHLLGARIIAVTEDKEQATAVALQEATATLLAQGRRPYTIPLGGSNAVGTLGYVGASLEIASQAAAAGVSFSDVFVTTGSGGTHAGLHLGLARHLPEARVHGISISRDPPSAAARVRALMAETAALLGVDSPTSPGLAHPPAVHGGYVGDGYAIPTRAGWEAILLAARTEGLILDPVYTGKALAGVIGLIRAGELAPSSHVLFVHTGGAPGLMAHSAALRAHLEDDAGGGAGQP